MDDLIDDYLRLVRGLDRAVGTSDPFTWLLDDRGPQSGRDPDAVPPAGPAEIAADAERIAAAAAGLAGPRAAWLAEHAHALRGAALRAAGAAPPLREQVAAVLAVDGGWIPDAVFDEAADLLDRGLPAGTGTLRERMDRWRRAHSIPAGSPDRMAALLRAAIAATVERTRDIIALPEEPDIDVALAPGPFRGLHRGGGRGTVYADPGLPFNTADLLSVAAHEGFPGHIAESMLKEAALADRPEAAVRFMPSPSFVVSEGLGLHAGPIVFPGDEAVRWLADNVDGFRDDGADLPLVHRARALLWGAWCNAALLAADGRPEAEVRRYLRDTALLGEEEAVGAAAYLGPYVFAYYHGARLLDPHVGDPASLRRLLTGQVAVAELRSGAPLEPA